MQVHYLDVDIPHLTGSHAQIINIPDYISSHMLANSDFQDEASLRLQLMKIISANCDCV